jgi:hypothetical protein
MKKSREMGLEILHQEKISSRSLLSMVSMMRSTDARE